MEDERLTAIETEKQNALTNSNNIYNDLLQDNQNLLDQQNDYASEYERVQNETLDKQLAYNEQLIEQQKEIARQNMKDESKRAKNDYLAYINPYGCQAESFASNGLLNSGVSETAKLGSYNTYQNRLASANKAMQDAITDYDNEINQARMDNDAQKAQNALTKLQLQMEALETFTTNKSTLAQNQLSVNQSIDDDYWSRYQTEYSNIQNELAQAEVIREWEAELAEQQRQYDTALAYQKEQDAISQQQWQKEYALSQMAYDYNYGDLDEDDESTSFLSRLLNKLKSLGSSGSTSTSSGSTSTVSNAKKTGMTAATLGLSGIDGSTPVLTANDKYYVLVDGQYIDVTDEYYNAMKYGTKTSSSSNASSSSDTSSSSMSAEELFKHWWQNYGLE